MKAYFGNVLSEQYFSKDQRKNEARYFLKWEVMQNGQLYCETHFIKWNHGIHYTSANNVFFISSASFYRIEDFELTPYQFLAKPMYCLHMQVYKLKWSTHLTWLAEIERGGASGKYATRHVYVQLLKRRERIADIDRTGI